MQRTQIQLPEPLLRQVKQIAEARDWSIAELVRRGIEAYVQTFPAPSPASKASWSLPLLRGSGGHLTDPAKASSEAQAIEARSVRRSARP